MKISFLLSNSTVIPAISDLNFLTSRTLPLTVISVLLLTFFIIECIGSWKRFNGRGMTIGKIIDFTTDPETNKTLPVVSYQVNGHEYTSKGECYYIDEDMKLGRTTLVFYKAEDPEDVSLDTLFLDRPTVIGTLLVIFIVILYLVSILGYATGII